MEVERAEVVDWTVDLVVGFCVWRVRDDLKDDMAFDVMFDAAIGKRRRRSCQTNKALQGDGTQHLTGRTKYVCGCRWSNNRGCLRILLGQPTN